MCCRTAGISDWAKHFIAITDDETPLSSRARTEGFRDVFINPFDIGGRYSALSFFGLVPAALMGQDIGALLRWGGAMLDEAQDEDVDVASQSGRRARPADGRGRPSGTRQAHADSAAAARARSACGSNSSSPKAPASTASASCRSPVKRSATPHVYGHDRAVRAAPTSRRTPRHSDREVQELRRREPIATIELPEPAALGAEFVRWEIATAVAGALLGINPFDEPNVQQAKDATRVLLDRYKTDHHLPTAAHDTTSTGVTMRLSSAARQALHGKGPESILTLLGPGDYLAVLAYLGPTDALDEVLQRFRMSVRDMTRVATMSSYGPRYLHSTGQLHKGGPNTGVFVLDHRARREKTSTSLASRSRSARSSSHRRSATSRRSARPIGARVHVHLPARDPRILNDMLTELLRPLATSDESDFSSAVRAGLKAGLPHRTAEHSWNSDSSASAGWV